MANVDDRSRSMSPARLESILDAYGADERAWPSEERRDAARAAAQADGRADSARMAGASATSLDAAMREAAAIDEALAAVRPPELPAGLRARVLADARSSVGRSSVASAARGGAWLRRIWPFSPIWQPALALAAAGVIGVLIGSTYPGASSGWDEADVSELAFGSDAEWDPEGQWEASWDD